MSEDLESKSEMALIVHLKGHRQLSACRFTRTTSEAPKTNGLIFVSARRGPEVNAPSGTYKVTLTVDFTLRMHRGASTEQAFRSKCAAIGERLEIQPVICAELLSRAVPDFHCYWTEVQDSDSTPKEDMHHKIFVLQIEAMPVSFKTANKLRDFLPTKTNF